MCFALLLGVLLIALSIGSNNSANALGICIGAGILNFKKAILIFGIFVFLGLTLSSQRVINTIGTDLGNFTSKIACTSLILSAIIILGSNLKKLPLSTHQVIVGSLIGCSIASGLKVNLTTAYHIFLSWVLSPVMASTLTFFLYKVFYELAKKTPFFKLHSIVKGLLVLGACVISYNTGANELATAVAPLIKGSLSFNEYTLFPLVSLSAFLGTVLFSHKVIETIGKGLVPLDPFSGLIAQFGAGLTLLIFTHLGMPVSTTYCIVGAIVGIGLIKGISTVKTSLLKKIITNFAIAPVLSGFISFGVIHFLRILSL